MVLYNSEQSTNGVPPFPAHKTIDSKQQKAGRVTKFAL